MRDADADDQDSEEGGEAVHDQHVLEGGAGVGIRGEGADQRAARPAMASGAKMRLLRPLQ